MQIVGVMFTAYNEGEELQRTLESVRSGTRQAHEIVVVDDGSTDGSCDAVASESVRVIRHERRVGVAASRNDACATARGEVLSEQKAFVSQKVRSDDEFFELFGGGGKATGARGSRQAGPASTPWSDEDYLLQQRRRSKPGEYKSIRPRVDAALHWMTEQIPAAALLDQRALDVGTRDGYAVEVFRQLGVAEAGGIELVPETAAYAARRGRAVRQADMRSLPDPDGWWDLVTCIHCLEHCPEPRRAVGELARVLRPGGWLFLVVPRQPSEASDPVHNCAFPDAESLRELVLGVGQFESTTLREETGVLARGRRELRLLVQRSKRNAVAASRGT